MRDLIPDRGVIRAGRGGAVDGHRRPSVTVAGLNFASRDRSGCRPHREFSPIDEYPFPDQTSVGPSRAVGTSLRRSSLHEPVTVLQSAPSDNVGECEFTPTSAEIAFADYSAFYLDNPFADNMARGRTI